MLNGFNTTLFWKIYSLSGRADWLDRFMVFSAETLGYLMVFGLIILFLKNRTKYREMALVALISAVVARGIFVSIIRFFYDHPRPFMVFENIKQLINHDISSSFPSGHASFYFALAAGVYLYNKKLGAVYLTLAGLIGFARIVAGVHWPYDILGGIALGVATALLIKFLIKKLPFAILFLFHKRRF